VGDGGVVRLGRHGVWWYDECHYEWGGVYLGNNAARQCSEVA